MSSNKKELAIATADVWAEREEQNIKWGQQDHPSGTKPIRALEILCGNSRFFQRMYDEAVAAGKLTWSDILAEEVAEALEQPEGPELRKELVQVAAVALAWIECIDRRASRACKKCDASGSAPNGTSFGYHRCVACDGSGVVDHEQP